MYKVKLRSMSELIKIIRIFYAKSKKCVTSYMVVKSFESRFLMYFS